MYKVRFNLEAGEHFRKWQVKHGDSVKYYSPETCTLQMLGCTLHNNPRIAEKIFNGANKSVCAWIECDNLNVSDRHDISRITAHHSPIAFNPRVKPYWTNALNDKIDGDRYLEIITDERKLLALRYF